MRISHDTAIELANALLDAVELAEQYNEEVNITQVKTKMMAFIGDTDDGHRFTIDPPIPKPIELKIVA